MSKMEYVFNELTRLYDMCSKNSTGKHDAWARIARAIATAEDVTIDQLKEEEQTDGSYNHSK